MSRCCRPWTELPLLVIDVETTGIGHHDRVVEIGLARFEAGELTATWSSLVDPGRPIPAEASAIHMIKDADVADAPPFNMVLHHVLRLAAGAYPVAYNAYFDKRFFLQEIRRTRLELGATPPFVPSDEWVDPFVWSWTLSPPTASNTLAHACLRRGVQLEYAHRASSDAVGAGRLLYTMANEIGEMTLCELLRRQRRYTENQRRSVDTWKNNSGEI